MSGQDWSDVLDEVDRVKAINAELLEAAEQCLDDMGDSLCVCEQAKEMLQAAVAKAIGKP